MFNATFNNISVLSWGSVLLDCQEKSIDMLQVTDKLQTLSHNVAMRTPRLELTTLVVIGTDYIGSFKSNYHTIMTTTTPKVKLANITNQFPIQRVLCSVVRIDVVHGKLYSLCLGK